MQSPAPRGGMLAYGGKIPQGLWNVEKILWKNLSENFLPKGLWKTRKFFTLACGKISVAAPGILGLFHINFHYGYYYCIKDIWIYRIYLYLQERASEYAFYL